MPKGRFWASGIKQRTFKLGVKQPKLSSPYLEIISRCRLLIIIINFICGAPLKTRFTTCFNMHNIKNLLKTKSNGTMEVRKPHR